MHPGWGRTDFEEKSPMMKSLDVTIWWKWAISKVFHNNSTLGNRIVCSSDLEYNESFSYWREIICYLSSESHLTIPMLRDKDSDFSKWSDMAFVDHWQQEHSLVPYFSKPQITSETGSAIGKVTIYKSKCDTHIWLPKVINWCISVVWNSSS